MDNINKEIYLIEKLYHIHCKYRRSSKEKKEMRTEIIKAGHMGKVELEGGLKDKLVLIYEGQKFIGSFFIRSKLNRQY